MISLSNKNIVGLVGMSGAGKSTVCKRFSDNGYTIIDCDIVAREVAACDSPFLAEVCERISAELICADGSLDRRKTAELIFNNVDARLLYNSIIYPYITYNVIEKIKAVGANVLLDAPTLFDAGLEMICTDIVSVCADKAVCEERIIRRDGISRELAVARLSSQHSIDYYQAKSDYCIINNGTEEELFLAADDVICSLKGE